ncbi:hypothetical protein ACFQZU_01435 [Streptomonospora algeriensis]|uniref:FAD-binding domain-containing protein n=1 Tax=Streptomonospora algeriensis TaxID=995084 RepID=A0ABW3B9G0_9ACTN
MLRKEAGAGLLDTYEQERLPVAELTVEQALNQLHGRTAEKAPGGDGEAERSPFAAYDYYATVFGYRYSSEAVCADGDADADPRPVLDATELRGIPGTRAPHAPIRGLGSSASTLDLFGAGFVLLAGSDSGDWAEGMRAVNRRSGARVDVRALGTDIGDPEKEVAAAYRLDAAGAVLVRPDGFVAWRADEPAGSADTAEALLAGVLRRCLCAGEV